MEPGRKARLSTPLKLEDVQKYIIDYIEQFNKRRKELLEELTLQKLLIKKNQYLYAAKTIKTPQDLIAAYLNAELSASEESSFGGFLEDLANFVAERTLRAQKSSTTGVDLQYEENGTIGLITIKSGLNWGNSDQWKKLESNLQVATKVLKQSKRTKNVRCILGVCYGKSKRTMRRGIIEQMCGQDFWFFLSGRRNFYQEIMSSVVDQANRESADFEKIRTVKTNALVKEFTSSFCDETGNIMWNTVLQFNSGNLENETL